MEDFLNWLANNKKMTKRSSRDVVSRIRRVKRLLDIDEITKESVSRLEEEALYQNYSVSIKSQLKRAVLLKLEYEEEHNVQKN